MHKKESHREEATILNQNTKRNITSSVPTVSVVGARGYSGLEIVRLLLNHSGVDLKFCFATEAFDLKKYFSATSHQEKINSIQCLSQSEILNHKTDIVFLATPAEISLKLAPLLIEQGTFVIDISGAFRLKKNDYKNWYGFDHDQKKLLSNAIYGIHPWVKADQFPSFKENEKTKLIANPGCYPTSIILALAPLLKDGLIHSTNIVIDAKSGTTGAGKKASENLLYSEVDGECLPYKIGSHQHYPEIQEVLTDLSGQEIDFHFSTSLLATRRGIISNIFCTTEKNITETDIQNCYKKYYDGYSMIHFGSFSENPNFVSLKKVVGTNKNFISYKIEKNNSGVNAGKSKLYLFSVIDNLLKGAAGQAVENMNRYYDYPVDMGLSSLEALQ